MKNKIKEHISATLLVTLVIGVMLFFAGRARQSSADSANEKISGYVNLPFVLYDDPFHMALFKDVLNIYYPGRAAENEEILRGVQAYRESRFAENLQTAHIQESLSSKKLLRILWMYVHFLLVYALVMALTYYGVQTLGVVRFVRKKQKSESAGRKKTRKTLRIVLKAAGKSLAYFVLFSPAYIIAYSVRTEFKTDTTFFMVLLAVLSNGLLVTYANKFYAFLTAESRKGYVETARVKNLDCSYRQDTPNGISYRQIFAFRKRFDGHVFQHIFANARHQYLSTIKEQASFLITGLMIIEMALNIHGHLSYEMLRQILYKNYDIVLIVVLLIFYTVKMTEMLADIRVHRENLRYEN